jgi:hypothetical protein
LEKVPAAVEEAMVDVKAAEDEHLDPFCVEHIPQLEQQKEHDSGCNLPLPITHVIL